MRFTMISVVVNSGLSIALFPFFAERGIAAAESIAGWLSTIMLFVALRRRGHLNIEPALVGRAIRMLIASVIMAVAAHYAAVYFSGYLHSGVSSLTQAAVLLPIVFGAFALYLVIVFAIGGADIGMIRRNIKRRGKAAPVISDDPA